MSTNRRLLIMRYEQVILQARTQIKGNEIRLIELEEQKERSHIDIAAQKKLISENEVMIKQQEEEIAKEQAAKIEIVKNNA